MDQLLAQVVGDSGAGNGRTRNVGTRDRSEPADQFVYPGDQQHDPEQAGDAAPMQVEVLQQPSQASAQEEHGDQ